MEYKYSSHLWQYKHLQIVFWALGPHQIQHQEQAEFLISGFAQLLKAIVSDKFLKTFYKYSQSGKSLLK